MRAKRFLPVQMILGEGPVWDRRDGSLRWVDITGGALWRCDWQTGALSCRTYGENVGMAQPARDGGWVLALEKSVVLERDGALTSIVEGVEAERPENRFNDGVCDAAGRLWLGTMHRGATRPEAALYRIQPDGRYERAEGNLTVSNGLAFSPDNRYLYHVDTPARTVYRYDFDVETGAIVNRQKWIDAGDEPGCFDGIAVDAQGTLWAAHWGGFQVTRWDPVSRRKLDTLPIPVPNPTACCFAGPGLTTLVITTGMGLDRGLKHAYPELGSLYACQTDTRGLPPFEMAL
ncbi:MAG: SMP-30/gluconolactonase/LRE family protein [Clostridiales bacterium]|nr:SMP-30/gluconolactonase/LRE family protein [Clostridiales bacterium]